MCLIIQLLVDNLRSTGPMWDIIGPDKDVVVCQFAVGTTTRGHGYE